MLKEINILKYFYPFVEIWVSCTPGFLAAWLLGRKCDVLIEEFTVVRLAVQVGEFEANLDSSELVCGERAGGQTDEVREASLGLYQGQVPAESPLVMNDNPVEGDEGLGAGLLEVLHLSPGQKTLRRGEDEVVRDGRPDTEEAGGRHDLIEPRLALGRDFPQPARAVRFSPVSQPVGRGPGPPVPSPPPPPHLLAILEAALVEEELAAGPGVDQPTGWTV